MQKNWTNGKARSTMRSMIADTTLGQLLKTVRGDRSLRHMAEACGVGHSLLSQIEADEVQLPRKDTMDAISRGYGIPLDTLARFAYCGGRRIEEELVSVAGG